LVRDDRAKYAGGVYNESTLVLVVGIVIDCLVDRLETGGEDGSGSVSRVLGSVSGMFALLSAAAPAVSSDVTFRAALVALDTGLNLLRALPRSLFCLSMYAWVAGFAFSDDALEHGVLPESIDDSSETYPFPPRPGFFNCCPMVAASAVSGSLRLGVPVDVSVGVGVDSCEADAGLIVILDAVLRVDIDMGGSLSGFSPYKVRVPERR
jgi:hypothetical protein